MASYEHRSHPDHDADFRHLDTNQPIRRDRDNRVTPKTDARPSSSGKTAWDASACVQLLRAIDVEETDVKRRELLFELALVLGGSQALDLLRILTPDEEERLAGVLRNTWRIDEATVQTFEKLSLHAREADNLAGSATLLPAANGQRAAVARLLARDSMPPGLRDRLLDTYAQMSELAGVLTYDLLDYAAAEQPLRDACARHSTSATPRSSPTCTTGWAGSPPNRIGPPQSGPCLRPAELGQPVSEQAADLLYEMLFARAYALRRRRSSERPRA